jgi:ABC-2 type transport system permease protein
MTTATQTQSTSAVDQPKPQSAVRRKSGFLAKAPIIARRELKSYFVSPIAYVAMSLFLLASGAAFSLDFASGQPALMRHVFQYMLWFLAIVVPILCMGSISQEWSSGTIETLMTAPVTDTEVVVGKYLGSLGFLLVLLVPTLIYVVLLKIYSSSLDFWPVVSGYLGMILTGSLFVAVSLFCSALTRSQVVAAVSALAILTLITVLPWLVGAWVVLPEFWRKLVDQAVYARYADFSKGIIDSGHVIFFLVSTAMFLFFTSKVLESRRWK